MASYTFLHAADLHLDTPFEGLGAVRPELAEQLREASLRAFDRLIDLAIGEGVAFVLLAGDIYDGIERGLRARLRFLRGMERLSGAGIPAFVVHGNHDPVTEGWSVGAWPHAVHVFEAGEVRGVPVVREGVRLATVHGVSFSRREERENLARRFRRGPEDGLHVGLLHCNVEGQQGHDPYAPCSPADLTAAGLDYWALGHVHTRATLLSRAGGEQTQKSPARAARVDRSLPPRAGAIDSQALRGGTWAAYPGNLQGRSFKPSEQGPKGALLVHVEDDSVRELEFRALAPIVFGSVSIAIEGHADLPVLERALVDAATEAADVPGCEGLMLRAEVRGRGSLHHELGGDLEALRQALEDGTAGRRPWIRWERLERATSPGLDRERIAERGDLAGEILRRIDALVSDPQARRNLVDEVERELLSPSLSRQIAPLADEDFESLLREVETDALDRLEVEP